MKDMFAQPSAHVAALMSVSIVLIGVLGPLLAAGAKAGLHGGDSDRWTEEYQANIYRHQLGMLSRIAQLRGMSPWCLMDFRSPNRPLAGIQDEFNRKGLISDQGMRKQAFFILQKAYKEKTVGRAE